MYPRISSGYTLLRPLIVGLSLAILTGCLGDDRSKEEARSLQEEKDRAARDEARKAKIAQEAAALPIACRPGGERFKKATAEIEAGRGRSAFDAYESCGAFFADAEVKALYIKAENLLRNEERRESEIQAAAAKRYEAAAKKVAAFDKAERKRQGVRIGMSVDDVLASSWGRPQSVNRTTTAWGVREQWVYETGNYLYFENGILTAVQN